ncbi:hypothetical protein GGI04_003362 [Coemansia thaxteri]|uniref:Peptidase C51 domain-containing protein n=1 Tax=Coemansia thaxteri TaxID=2663907 RepID=A0A9W8EH20_9FUNG|nr:hypothetical protein GGI04_003362 [Coemansia thaxteri]KAJ2006569.1 hypothetical protein H4R26_001290 [Coemansia thaxteri]KAJ2470204.1 hypothetical protein GGI02_003081 [Coemansia sp. RSA 2322]KAJ2480568.1 hypothetical protein EV174_003696 [Coemansia sp. RSA 2320]
MKLVAAFALCITSLATISGAYRIYNADVVNCRSSPSTSGSVAKMYKANDDLSLACQISAENIKGNTLWDKTTDGCYVSDYYVKTGSVGYVVGKCDSSGSTPSPSDNGKIPGPVKDDYPYPGECDGIDPWHYYKCQCTSFVAWRINSRLGVKFNNYYKGPNWGNANTWDDAARKTGVTINSTPVPGCVAQTDSGSAGHVAWVAKVSGDSVTVEEYNYAYHKYSTRTVPKSAFKYIHISV